MSLLITTTLLSLLCVAASPAPVKGIFPDQDKTQLYALYDRFALLEEKYDRLYHSATAREGYYYETRTNKTATLDRTVSSQILQAKTKYSLFNGTYAEDIEGFLKEMAEEYRKQEDLVDNMKRSL